MEGQGRASEAGSEGGPELPEPLRRLEQFILERASAGDLPLPPYPAVAARVQATMARKGFSLGEVAELIGADAALAADVLRCANSVIYRRGAPVIDLTQALTRVGVQEVMRILLASGLAGPAQSVGPLAPLRRLVWIEGLAGAAVCQELARLRGLRMEDAFTVGLLHDFGKVVAVAALEGILEAERREEAFSREAWERVLERLHLPVGRALATRWRLPALVGEIIGAHHEPGARCSEPRLLEVVRCSDAVVALLLGRARVTEADLAAAPGVAPAERGPLALLLEQIPEFVAAFESPAAGVAVATPRILPPPEPAGLRPTRFGVSVSVARRPRMFSASAVGEGALLLTGEEPLPEERLLEAKLYGPEPFSIWLLTRQCRRVGPAYQVEAQPFALTGPLRELWDRLVSGDAR